MSSVPMTELSAPLVDIGDIAYSFKHGAENKNPPSPAPTTEASERAKLIACSTTTDSRTKQASAGFTAEW